MNNIYKVIWSKAKNCYVVASEIARSHTKSASGSEKIGGGTRRKLLASLMALSLLCGGLGVANAENGTVHVADIAATETSKEVYTAEKVNTLLGEYGKKSDVEKNANDITTMNTTITTQGQSIATNVANIDNNTKAIEQKINTETANERFATKDALRNLQSEVTGKVDENTFEGALDLKADTDLGNLTDEGKAAIKNAMSEDMKLKADKTYVDTEVGKVNTKLAGYAETADLNIATGRIDDNEADIAKLKEKTAEISHADGAGTSISGVTIKDGNIIGNNSAITGLTNVETGSIKTDSINGKNLEGNMVATDKDVEKAVKAETDAREAADTALGQRIDAEIANRKTSDTALDQKINKEIANRKTSDTALDQKINKEIQDRNAADAALEGKITKNSEEITKLDGSGVKYDTAVKDTITLKGPDGTKITHLKDADLSDSSTDAVTGKQLNKTNEDLKTEAQTREYKDTLLSGRADALEKNTGGITRNDAKDETYKTYIEKNVTVDNQGSITAKGKVTAKGGVDAGAGAITTTGAVNAGSLNVTDASNLKGDVTMDNALKVKGDTSLKKTDVDGALNVTGESNLKGDVTLGTPNGTNTVTVNGTANFQETVKMNNGLNVTNGETNLKKTTVDGNLKVTGTITTDKMVFGDKATNNYTEIDKGHITSKNDALAGDATKKSSSMELDHSKLEVAVADKDSNGHLTMTADKTTIKNSDLTEKNYSEIVADKDSVTTTVKDEKNNTTSTKSSATEIRNYAKDKDGNKTINVQTATQNKSWAKDKDGNESSIVQTGKDITNTAEKGTITNKAKDIVNEATGDMTNTVGGQLKTTVTGQATEEFKNGLDTTVNGTEKHTVNGKQINTVTEGQENNISGGQINNILTGNQETTVSNGSIINKADNGDISNTAKNVTNEGTESVTNKVGANEVKVSSTDGVDIKAEAGKKITESVGTASRVVENDKITDTAGNSTVTTENGKGTTFGNGSTGTTNIYGDSINTGTIKAKDTTTDKLTAGAAAGVDGGRLTVDANDGVKGSYKYGDYTSKSYILPNTLMSGVDNGKDITDTGFVGSRTDHYMDDDKAKLNETVKDADGSNVTKKTSTKTYTEIKDTNGNTLSVNQKADGNNYKLEDQDGNGNTNHVTNSATQSKQTLKDKDGNTLTTNQTATKNNFDLKSADGSKENHTTNTVDESRVAIKGENGKAELSTTDEGTTFKHSAAKKAFTEGGATNTTIKGNTITTGKVTMDYADVMKDLGVHGNATVDKDMTVKGNTTLGEAGKDTTLTVNSKATFNNGLTVTKGETKLKNTTIEGTLNVFEDATFQKDVTANSFSVNGKTYIDSDGLNANNQVIRNVADGSISEGSKDAVNGGQLYQVKNDLEGKVNKVGANAAAMANLHPMEFDPDSKWNIAAAMGNYGSETATAIGAFYRPNEDVMVNFSTAFGTGENMVGGGVSVRLGKGSNKLSREESNALKDQVDDLTARMDALLSVLNPNMSKDFPDVPENHWAYEAVSRLAGNDIVQGYPDGEFHGDRTMTRYEMAEIIYNALSRGAEAERELVEEFKPELQAMAASEKATAERAEG